ncbi:DUF2470 domain-containing protein [Streptomyces sp. NPDC093094]|uniref:DUF2470 domain-containing protein n=1 Tax=Streptomyces sp. NPDC093094 TaxID=3366026 RepID=UPI00382DE14C
MSTDTAITLPEPTAAERVRTVLARAVSLSLTTAGQDHDLIGMHSVDAGGRITLHPPAGSPLARQAAEAAHGSLAGLLEFTDIAPTAARDRVRARVTVSGWLAPTDGGDLRLDTARVWLRTPADTVDVGLDEIALAGADPLAVEEAAMLTHMADAHEELTRGLVALAGPRLPRGVVRAVPYALDSRSVTLRCEYAYGHCDLRLMFPEPARDGAEAGERIRQMLAPPGRCACPHHSSERP